MTDRESKVGDSEPPPSLTPEQAAPLEASNTLRQYDSVVEQIRSTLSGGKPLRLRPSTLATLNRLAVEGLVRTPGALRTKPIKIIGSQHQPPAWTDVASHLDDLCDYVNDNLGKPPLHLAAYVMWRLNWIHPFEDGNGRTSRAASYFVLCVGLGYLIPGPRTIPERIAVRKKPYYAALEAADAAWERETLDVSAMEELLSSLLAQQLMDVHVKAKGGMLPDLPEAPGGAWGGGD